MAERRAPSLSRLSFLEDNPSELWSDAEARLKWWEEKKSNASLFAAMEEYKRQRALTLVWISNQLEGTLPDGISQQNTYKLLESLYDDDANDGGISEKLGGLREQNDGDDAEKDRLGKLQLGQHMLAYKKLCEGSKPLTEDLIQETHRILMNGLKTEEGTPIKAGEYRQIALRAGDHVFLPQEHVSRAMEKLVLDYNRKANDISHDPYELASWLLYHFVTIHPFEDGNGRMCRLLACYSLLRDGLPFPVTITTGHKKAHKHYVQCIERDRYRGRGGQPHLTTLMLHSVIRVWSNFMANLWYNPSILPADIFCEQ